MKNLIKGGLSFIVGTALLGGCSYLMYTKIHNEPPSENKNWCAEVIYFNLKKHKIDTTYCQAILNDDSIVSFKSPSGQNWTAKQFIDKEDIKIDYRYQSDITVSNGDHFKVTPISDTVCLTKIEMDDLKDGDSPDSDN